MAEQAVGIVGPVARAGKADRSEHGLELLAPDRVDRRGSVCGGAFQCLGGDLDRGERGKDIALRLDARFAHLRDGRRIGDVGPFGQADHQGSVREVEVFAGRAQHLAAGDGQRIGEAGGVATHHGDVRPVAGDEDVRRARPAQAAEQADLVVELRPKRVDQHGLQALALDGGAKTFGQFAGIDRAVVDDGEMLAAPALAQNVGGGLSLGVRARREARDEPAGLCSPVGQRVRPDPGCDGRDAGILQQGQGGFDRFGAEESGDDADPGFDEGAGRARAAFGRALVVGHDERRAGLADRRFCAGLDLRT